MVSTYLKSRSWEPGQSSRRLMETRLQKHSLSMIMVSQTGWKHCSLGWFCNENVNKNFFPLCMYNVIWFAQLFWAANHATPNPHPTQAHKLACYQQQNVLSKFRKTTSKKGLRDDILPRLLKTQHTLGVLSGCLISFVQLIGGQVF